VRDPRKQLDQRFRSPPERLTDRVPRVLAITAPPAPAA
jgi:hypothetical protein